MAKKKPADLIWVQRNQDELNGVFHNATAEQRSELRRICMKAFKAGDRYRYRRLRDELDRPKRCE